jgi:ribonuclease T1
VKNFAKTVYLLFFLIFTVTLVIYYSQQSKNKAQEPVETNSQTNTKNTPSSPLNSKKIPVYVYEVYDYIIQNDKAPSGYVGGRTFFNREKKLPLTDRSRQKIRYREWDVHPKKEGVNRGPERLVTGSDQSAYYTSDHYKNFITLKTESYDR